MMRIKIEHAFGILKSKFRSLRGIPIHIKGPKDLHLVNIWIRVCVILNNFLLDQDDDLLTIKMKDIWEQEEVLEREAIDQRRESNDNDRNLVEESTYNQDSNRKDWYCF